MTRTSLKLALFCVTILSGLFCFQNSYANYPKKGSWFWGADAGITWPSINRSDSVANGSATPPPTSNDLYIINKPSTTSIFSIFGGYRHLTEHRFFPAYSLTMRYQHLNTFTVKGTIQQYSSPAFTNYNYHFDLSSNIYALQGKVNLVQFGRFAPYLSGGIGMSRNTLENYKESPTAGVTPRVSPSYDDNTTNTFMYDLGAGVDINLSSKCFAYIGYEYENLGKLRSGHGSADWSSQAISMGTLKTSNILFGFSWLIS